MLPRSAYRSGAAIRLHGSGSLDKAAGIVAAFDSIWEGVVLDVGCRGRELEQALHGRPVRYLGLEVRQPADVVASLEDGIPLGDGEADVVVALDVLEHVDSIHAAFAELCRVARRHVVIALPNAYVLEFRWRHLRGRPLSKYGLPREPHADRHRWFFSFEDARAFCRYRAELSGWVVADEAVVVGPRRGRIEPIVRTCPNLLSPSLVSHLVPAAAT